MFFFTLLFFESMYSSRYVLNRRNGTVQESTVYTQENNVNKRFSNKTEYVESVFLASGQKHIIAKTCKKFCSREESNRGQKILRQECNPLGYRADKKHDVDVHQLARVCVDTTNFNR